MSQPLPVLILAGSDRKPGPSGPGLSADEMLSGFKGALRLPSGRTLISCLIERLLGSGRFREPIVIGPVEVYQPLVGCEVVHAVGSLLVTLETVARLLLERFPPGEPVAIISCDILPSEEDLRQILVEGHDPVAGCQFWWQIVTADQSQMGSSSWKPRYRLRLGGTPELTTVYPGHLAIVRATGLRLDLLKNLLVLAYRQRNRPLFLRFLPILFGGLGLLTREDLRHLVQGRPTLLAITMPWHLIWAYVGVMRGTLTLRDFERHLAATVVQSPRLRDEHPFVIHVTRRLAFAKDIDTQGELQGIDA